MSAFDGLFGAGTAGVNYFAMFNDAPDYTKIQMSSAGTWEKTLFEVTADEIKNAGLKKGDYHWGMFVGLVGTATEDAALHMGWQPIRWSGTRLIDMIPRPSQGSIVEVGPAMTLQMSRRADGTIHANRPIRIGTDDQNRPYVALDFANVFGSLQVTNADGPTVSPSGELSVVEDGPQGTRAIVLLSGGHKEGQYRVDVRVTMQNGTVDTGTFYVIALDPPSAI